MGIIQASIPLFFVLIAAELLWSRVRGVQVARLNDSIADLSCGILSQLAGIFTKLFGIGIFIWVGNHWTIQRAWPSIPAWPQRAPFAGADAFPWFGVDAGALTSWAVVFVLVDFCYYWSHRLSHEVQLLWAGHVVHHSSEEYNLPVALRQSALHGLFTWIFYTPLAVIGVPWQMYVACNALNLVYQFWIHTRAIGTLGPLSESILNTPSHHRVHHGVNRKYLDKNYGGVFIVFDRWFGTFQREEEEVVYGITHALRSWNPLWANVHVYWAILRDAWRAPNWRDRLGYVFGPPGWRPADAGGREVPPEVRVETFAKYDTKVSTPLAWYGFAHFTVGLVAAFLVLQYADRIPLRWAAAAAFFVAVTLAGVGGVFERAKWAGVLETARLITLGVAMVAAAAAGMMPVWAAGLAGAFAVASLAVLLARRSELTELELAPLM